MTIKLLKWSVFFSRYQMLVTVNLNRKKQLFPNLQESVELLFIHEAQAMWIDVKYYFFLLFFYFFLLFFYLADFKLWPRPRHQNILHGPPILVRLTQAIFTHL